MVKKRNILVGIAIGLFALIIIVVFGLPILINVITGKSALTGVTGSSLFALVVVGPVVLVLGFMPFVTALTASNKRKRKIDKSE